MAKVKLYKQFRDIKGLDDVIETYVDFNLRAINGITDKMIDKLTKRIVSGVKKGKTNEEIARSIQYSGAVDKSIYNTLKTRTKLLADRQISLLNADLTKLRCKVNGVKSFFWKTRLDERVRPEHAILEGQLFRFDKLPPEGLPGSEFGCRCWIEIAPEEDIEE